MKLRRLRIGRFKNLRDFTIDFGRDMQTLTTVLLGQNGTGKSNLLEALIIIFRDLDLGDVSEFWYVLRYECRRREIEVDSDPTRGKSRRERVKITVRHPGGEVESIPYNQRFYGDPERRYLPSYVFGYYSGPSNRMEKHFDKHQKRFYDDLREGREKPSRPLLYARPVHSQFALLSFFTEAEEDLKAGEQSMRDFLNDLLGIEELVSVMFVLREPPWNSKEGDPRFWNARGVVSKLAARIYELAQAPMRLNVRITPEFANKQSLEHLYLYLRSADKLKVLASHYTDQNGKYSPQEFFKALESTYISKILSEVRIRLQRRDADGSLTFRDLSEGEQQLLMVLGLLRFTKEDEALFLLDEPDTHLNPAWSVQYLKFMDDVVGSHKTSHVLMCTHNPLVISDLKRDNVRIMQRRGSDGYIYVETPREDPQGMGVNGILTSELFGLRTALDLTTQKKLDEQRVLAAKEVLNDEERERLGVLTAELDEMGFTLAEDDEVYAAFLKKWVEKSGAEVHEQPVLTPEQRGERERMVEEIIQELIAEGIWR